MWVRKRIEVSPSDLAKGLWYCLTPANRPQIESQIANEWQVDDAVVCLSVRSGFDLLLHSSGWQAGSEIIMSGLTIPDMPRIVEANQMKPVGVDIDLHTMCPDIEQIRQKITPQTKAIVVAHLLGGICDIKPLIQLARKHNLMVIEDCAQAYVGTAYQGDSQADVSMFSFGPIKTNTALAGGIFRVRQTELLQRMRRVHDQWKVQSRFTFGKRIGKYGFVKFLSTRFMCGSFYRLMRMFGSSHDGVASTMARGFAGPNFFERIRQQPSSPLLKLLEGKLRNFDPKFTGKRRDLGRQFCEAVGSDVFVLGSEMERQTWWVLPLLIDDPKPLVKKLWDAGFDASNNCSLHSIVDDETSTATSILRHIVFLPLQTCMPEREVIRMAELVRNAGTQKPLWIAERQDSAKSVDNPASNPVGV